MSSAKCQPFCIGLFGADTTAAYKGHDISIEPRPYEIISIDSMFYGRVIDSFVWHDWELLRSYTDELSTHPYDTSS